MRVEFPSNPEWETPLTEDVLTILKQPYHFIGKGAQSYVFESFDKNYVIKLFRYDQPNSSDKIALLFNACKIAFDSLADETGLVFIHLNETPIGLPTLYCKDAVGRKYKFRLDRVRFALQKKAKDFKGALVEAKEDRALMKKRIDQLVDLLDARTKKGVRNSDPSLSRNFGFLDDRAIEFDFGNYRLSDDFDRLHEIQRYTSKLRVWLRQNAPEWVSYLDERVEALQ